MSPGPPFAPAPGAPSPEPPGSSGAGGSADGGVHPPAFGAPGASGSPLSLVQRVAVISTEPTALLGQVASLPSRPQARAWPSLYAAVRELRRFRPHVLFAVAEAVAETGTPLSEEDAGAMRLLRALMPQLGLVIVVPRAHEVAVRPLVERIGAQLLTAPYARDDLASALSLALLGNERPGLDVLLDLSHGISDEINNPLLFALGHLQLLIQQLDPAAEVDRLERLQAVRSGLQRIEATMERLRLLHRAIAFRTAAVRAPLLPIVHGAIAEARAAGGKEIALTLPPELAGHEVLGDPELLQAAFVQLLLVAGELADNGAATAIAFELGERESHLLLQVDAARLPGWQLPRTFDPYYVNRILRGTPHGLGLFLVQCVVQAHGGRAVVRRRPDGTVLLDVMLPTAGAL